jgi:uncharacterized protein (DUF2235 family)
MRNILFDKILIDFNIFEKNQTTQMDDQLDAAGASATCTRNTMTGNGTPFMMMLLSLNSLFLKETFQAGTQLDYRPQKENFKKKR